MNNTGGEITQRSTKDVVESHLQCRKTGDLEGDLRNNYADDVLLMSAEGIHHGHDGVRYLAEILRSYVPDGAYEYRQVLAEGEVGMLVWTGSSEQIRIHDGADSFVIRNGRIAAQTIHYSTKRPGD